MEFLTNYIVPVIVGLCLICGFVVKKWMKDVDNKWIPTLVTVLGALLAVWMNWSNVTPEVILGGCLSGLASTGLHQLFKQLIDNGGMQAIKHITNNKNASNKTYNEQ